MNAPQFQTAQPEADFPIETATNFENGNEFLVFTPRKKESYLRRIGGGSLTLSLALHAVLILVAFFLVKFAVEQKQPEPPDFLPGGGGGGKSNQAKMDTKRRSVSMSSPKSRIVSVSPNSTITLPEVPMTNLSASMTGFAMPTGGGVGNGDGGINGSGRGGKMGNGFGLGNGPGSGAGFVAMFGKKLDSRRLAVVLDVSRSMHPFIPVVVKEANKISGGCPVMMFYGCGLQTPKDRSIERNKPDKADGRNFENFWRTTFGMAGKPMDKDDPLPTKEVFDVFNDRKDTYYYEKIGNYTWLALTANEVRSADAIYWFADFKDPVDQEQLEELAKTLIKRKQKLYVHASGDSPRSLNMVEDIVVKPTGGQVLKIDIKPAAK